MPPQEQSAVVTPAVYFGGLWINCGQIATGLTIKVARIGCHPTGLPAVAIGQAAITQINLVPALIALASNGRIRSGG